MLDELTIHRLLEEARACVEQGKYLHAVQLYRKLTVAAPFLDTPWHELAHVYAEMRNVEAAERALLEARDRSPDKEEITLQLGELQLRKGNFEKALAYYRSLVERETQLSIGLRTRLAYHLGLSYLSRGNVKLAEQWLRKVQRLDPAFPRINESIGEILLRRNALAEALQVLQTAVATDPYSWTGHFLLGIAYTRAYEWRRAYEQFATAIEMDPAEPSAWQMCGEVLLQLQQLNEAEEYLRKASELNPDSADVLAAFGMLHAQRRDAARALEFFERSLAIDPNNAKALSGRAALKHPLASRS